MDISQYTAQALLGPRNAALDPVQPIARKPQLSDNTASDPGSEPGGLFETVIDSINPLQHIPGVSSVYQEVTGDTANPLSAMAGGFLFGGPMGLAAGAAGSFLEMLTGKSLMGHAMALFSGDGASKPDAAKAMQAATVGDGSAMLAADPGRSVQQYQAFAEAATSIHQGIGAKASDVAWAENVWTQQSLKQATGSYEQNQRLGANANRTARIV